MHSGKFAALAAIEAINKNDFSKNILKNYETMLKESFILKDLYSYRNVMSVIEANAPSFLGFYPKKINEFMKTFTATDSIAKKEKYREFLKKTMKEKSVWQFAKDGVNIARLALEAILWVF